jgi:hypothetical protein
LRFVFSKQNISNYSFTSVVTAGAGFVHGVISNFLGVG